MTIQLNKRERISIGMAAIVICLFLAAHFLILPLTDKQKQLARAVRVKTKILEEIIVLKSKYDIIETEVNSFKYHLENRQKGFTLFSFLDTLAGEAGVKDNISYMKPSVSTQNGGAYKIALVEMKLQAISMNQLISYLHKVETSKNAVVVKGLSISKEGKQTQRLNAVLQVETYRL